MKKFLSIDYWKKRCGLAFEINLIAMPHKIIDTKSVFLEVWKLLIEKKITDIVVWLPYDLYQKDTTRLEIVKNFIVRLKKKFPDIEIHWHDERFSSFEAWNILDELNFKWDKSKNKDDLSACIILESFLKAQKKD